MQNLITAEQMHQVDAATIKQLPISSIDLMEQAAKAFVKVFESEIPNQSTNIAILCGQGNNGGDGLAVARLLNDNGYSNTSIYLVNFGTRSTGDYRVNLIRLKLTKLKIIEINEPEQLNGMEAEIIVDAILGSGLNKPLSGRYQELVSIINQLNKKVIAVDVPTGFNSEGSIEKDYKGMQAEIVITFQRPKINFFFPESVKAFSTFKVVDIGLSESFIDDLPSNWKLITQAAIAEMIKPRLNFSHKGTFGHALIVAGNDATMGAALLCARASLHAGSGLTTVCLPKSGLTALNSTLPEVMALHRAENLDDTLLEKFTAFGIGPGLGLEKENEQLFNQLLNLKKPMVIDADAITMLSENKVLIARLPAGTILTPHMKEFDRLFGEHNSWWERVLTAQKVAKSKQLVIVLKNRYTFVCLPTGEICINPTGNPAMASGGMGDVLTGIITSFLAQGYTSADAAILSVYLHGKTGDKLAKKKFVVTASEVAKGISATIARFTNSSLIMQG